MKTLRQADRAQERKDLVFSAKGDNPQPVRERVIRTEVVERGGKRFEFVHGKNHRGEFVRICEVANGVRNYIMVPMEAYEEFSEAVCRFDISTV